MLRYGIGSEELGSSGVDGDSLALGVLVDGVSDELLDDSLELEEDDIGSGVVDVLGVPLPDGVAGELLVLGVCALLLGCVLVDVDDNEDEPDEDKLCEELLLEDEGLLDEELDDDGLAELSDELLFEPLDEGWLADGSLLLDDGSLDDEPDDELELDELLLDDELLLLELLELESLEDELL